MYNEFWGKFHFWWTLLFVNLLFFPQHFLGLAGMPRRIPDYNVVFADWNLVRSIGAFGMFITPFLMFAILWSSKRSGRSEEPTSELQSLMRISYAVFCLNTKKT